MLKQVLETARKQVADFAYRNFSSDHIPGLLIYNTPELPAKFKVILNAHLDVVPGRPDQFQARISDGKLYGRGAIDMKAAAAAEILAFAAVARKVDYPLGLQLVTDEELGGHHGTLYQIQQGIATEFYLCGEYSFLNICLETKGVLWLKLTTSGVRAHGAYPWKGTNAIAKLAREVSNLTKSIPTPTKESWVTTCNPSVIEGGDTVNQVPDSASVTLDIRRIPRQTAADIISRIKSHLVYPDTKLEILKDEPANLADKTHPLVKKFARAVTSHTHIPAKFVKFHGASDARHYSAHGATAIDIGPSGEGLHSDTEWVDLASLESYLTILKTFLSSL